MLLKVFPNNTMNIAKIREMNAYLKETYPEYVEKMNKISEICATKGMQYCLVFSLYQYFTTITIKINLIVDIADTDECIAAKKMAQCYVEEADKVQNK